MSSGEWNILLFAEGTFYERGCEITEEEDDYSGVDPTYVPCPQDICDDDDVFTEGMGWNEADIVEGVVLQDMVVIRNWNVETPYEYSYLIEDGVRDSLRYNTDELAVLVRILFTAGRRKQAHWKKMTPYQKRNIVGKERKNKGAFDFKVCILVGEWYSYDDYNMEADGGIEIIREFDLSEISQDPPADKKDYGG